MVLVLLPSAAILAVMYHLSLARFGRILEEEQPDLLALARRSEVLPSSRTRTAYRVLRGVKRGAFQGVVLSGRALETWSSTRRLLYIAVSLVCSGILLGLVYDSLLY